MKFVLLKFYKDGVMTETHLVDAYCVSAEEPYSFPVKVGDVEFSVEAVPIK